MIKNEVMRTVNLSIVHIKILKIAVAVDSCYLLDGDASLTCVHYTCLTLFLDKMKVRR